MMRAFVLYIFLITAALCVQAQAPAASVNTTSTGQTELTSLNKDMLAAYHAGNYDEALRIGQQALDMSTKISGEESRDTASVLFNLGAVYRAKKQFKEAEDNFQRSLAIYTNHFSKELRKILAIYNEMGLISYEKLEKKESEKWFLKALELSERINGIESKDTIAYVTSLATIYKDLKEYEKAEAYFWRMKQDAIKVFGAASSEMEKYDDEYSCYAFIEADHLKDVVARRKAEAKRILEEKIANGTSGIINGKAKVLSRPIFPWGAGAGSVMVRVQIDESGNVIKARAFCGPRPLWMASENAAFTSKFYPTLLKGIAVKVTGIIVYNFQH